MGMSPGNWKRFLPGDAVFPVGKETMRGTLHDAGLAEALALAEALDILPPELIFYCMQPASTDWSPDLTEPVNSSIPALCAAISAEIEEYHENFISDIADGNWQSALEARCDY
jgi:hydrogenase maturation protease